MVRSRNRSRRSRVVVQVASSFSRSSRNRSRADVRRSGAIDGKCMFGRYSRRDCCGPFLTRSFPARRWRARVAVVGAGGSRHVPNRVVRMPRGRAFPAAGRAGAVLSGQRSSPDRHLDHAAVWNADQPDLRHAAADREGVDHRRVGKRREQQRAGRGELSRRGLGSHWNDGQQCRRPEPHLRRVLQRHLAPGGWTCVRGRRNLRLLLHRGGAFLDLRSGDGALPAIAEHGRRTMVRHCHHAR